jgi:hypothetical protein
MTNLLDGPQSGPKLGGRIILVTLISVSYKRERYGIHTYTWLADDIFSSDEYWLLLFSRVISFFVKDI